MKHLQIFFGGAILSALVIALGCAPGTPEGAGAETAMEGDGSPMYEVDPFWPKPLPNNWLLGAVGGMAVDAQDHVWIIQRPGSLEPGELLAIQDPPGAECCAPAPPVLEFDAEGNFIPGLGRPGRGLRMASHRARDLRRLHG